LFRSLGIRELAEKEMESLLQQAFEALDSIEGADKQAKAKLKAFAQYLIAREE
jgi:geranylgeranyl pyrophosphate synthase